jgi:hypothetical protein
MASRDRQGTTNFETGAGWGRKKPAIPLCHSAMRSENLPDPLRALQAQDLENAADCELLVQRLCQVLNCDAKAGFDFRTMAASVRPQLQERKLVIAIDLSHRQGEWDSSRKSIFQIADNPASDWMFYPIRSAEKLLSREFREASGLVFASPWRCSATTDTIDIIREWVLNGGRLLLLGYELGDLHHNANLGDLGRHFGIQFTTDIVGPPDHGPDKPYGVPVDFQVSDAEPHPFTAGLETIRLQNVQTLSVAPGGIEWLRVGRNEVYRPRRDTVDYKDRTLIQPASADYDRNSSAGWLPVAAQGPRGLSGNGAVCAIGTWQISNPDPNTTELLRRSLNWLVKG